MYRPANPCDLMQQLETHPQGRALVLLESHPWNRAVHGRYHPRFATRQLHKSCRGRRPAGHPLRRAGPRSSRPHRATIRWQSRIAAVACRAARRAPAVFRSESASLASAPPRNRRRPPPPQALARVPSVPRGARRCPLRAHSSTAPLQSQIVSETSSGLPTAQRPLRRRQQGLREAMPQRQAAVAAAEWEKASQAPSRRRRVIPACCWSSRSSPPSTLLKMPLL